MTTWMLPSSFYRDLKRAEIKQETSDGEIDFHALRTTYVTSLARAGVPLAMAQRLARHSTPTLTANHYTKLELSTGGRRWRSSRTYSGEKTTAEDGEAGPIEVGGFSVRGGSRRRHFSMSALCSRAGSTST